MADIIAIVVSLARSVNLGFVSLPVFVIISAGMMTLGLGLRLKWLSLSGVFIAFMYYMAYQIGFLMEI